MKGKMMSRRKGAQVQLSGRNGRLLREIKRQIREAIGALQGEPKEKSKRFPLAQNRNIIKALFLKKPGKHAGESMLIISPEQVVYPTVE